MAGMPQTTINKINQLYEQGASKIPAEWTVRNVLIFCPSIVMYRFDYGGFGLYAICGANSR